MMSKGPLPSAHLDLLERPIMGQLTTVDPQGRPQVAPIRFLYNGTYLQLNVPGGTVELEHMRQNRSVALSVIDPENPARYLELRGHVIMFELFKTLTFVNQLAQKYTGADVTGGHAGEERYRITIAIDSWTAA